MKKLFNAFLFLVFISVSANAQWFVGGGFSFSNTGGSTKTGGNSVDKVTTSNLSFKPKVGYFFNEKFAFGGQLILSTNKVTTPGIVEQVQTTSMFGIAPFARYYAFKFNKFSLFGEAELDLVFGNSKTKQGSNTTDDSKLTNFGLYITPGISYALSEKFELETNINLFSFGYSLSTEKYDAGNSTVTDKTSRFGIGAGMDNIVTVGNITIGAIFKF